MQNFEYYNPTRLIFGRGEIASLTRHIPEGVRVLVTAGPTREAIDPVRYVSNNSSGKMGYAIADACVAAGQRLGDVKPVALALRGGWDAVFA